MANKKLYFSHDFATRTDPKIKKLFSKHGALGYGIFWAIIEDLYNNDNELQTDYETISYDLRIGEDIIVSIINDFDLFTVNNGYFGSDSVEKRLKIMQKKEDIGRENAEKRWAEHNAKKEQDKENQSNDECQPNANPLQTQCQPIADLLGNECQPNASKVNNSIIKDNKENNKKTNKKENYSDEQFQMFDVARKFFKGDKRGNKTEFDNFIAKNKDWQEILPLLLPAMVRELAAKEKQFKERGFSPQWKNLQTWINNSCWETEHQNLSQSEIDNAKNIVTDANGDVSIAEPLPRPTRAEIMAHPENYPNGTVSRCGQYYAKNGNWYNK